MRSRLVLAVALALSACAQLAPVEAPARLVPPAVTVVQGGLGAAPDLTLLPDALAGLADRAGAWIAAVEAADALAEAERQAAAERAREAAEQAAPTGYGYVGAVPCGGDLPACCVVRRESQGLWTALNPVSLPGEPRGAGGGYQFIPSTWWAYGGTGYADQAPPSEQIAVARRAWADWRGHWNPPCWLG